MPEQLNDDRPPQWSKRRAGIMMAVGFLGMTVLAFVVARFFGTWAFLATFVVLSIATQRWYTPWMKARTTDIQAEADRRVPRGVLDDPEIARTRQGSRMSEERRVVVVRALRGFADGFVSVLVVRYLTTIGFSPLEVGAVVTATLLGSAVLTLTIGLRSRLPVRTALLIGSLLMIATGSAFATVTAFVPLLIVAAVGTLNPSAGDVSVFLPMEQVLLTDQTSSERWPRLFGVYNLAGTVSAAVGALASSLPDIVADRTDSDIATAQRLGFGVYIATGVVVALLYRRLPRTSEGSATDAARRRRRPALDRRILELAALFSLDSAASGFAAQAILVLWLHLRFDLSAADLGIVFFATGLLGGFSQLVAGRIATRFGLVRTMVFSHLPANVLLATAGLAPTAGLAVALLLVRALFSQMDVPARQAFVMAVVPADQRAAAASLTNVPRSLAGAVTPFLAAAMLASTDFGWPLLIAGTLKAAYDLALFARFRNLRTEPAAAPT